MVSSDKALYLLPVKLFFTGDLWFSFQVIFQLVCIKLWLKFTLCLRLRWTSAGANIVLHKFRKAAWWNNKRKKFALELGLRWDTHLWAVVFTKNIITNLDFCYYFWLYYITAKFNRYIISERACFCINCLIVHASFYLDLT